MFQNTKETVAKLGSLAILIPAFFLSGCVVRTYDITKDRVDQELSSGNRGYLKGQAPEPATDRKTTRAIHVVEVELGSPVTNKKVTGIMDTSSSQTVAESQTSQEAMPAYETAEPISESGAPATYEKYTIQKNDTLQKISKKFYGTTKNWKKIFNANKDILKSPDRVIPGKVINIPMEALKEPTSNLK